MAGAMLQRVMSVVFGLAAGARWVSACEDPAQVDVPMVTLGMPEVPMYIGSYARVPVRIAPGLDLDFDDLAFRVTEGPQGGVVSMSRDATFNPKKPDIMLIAGWRPGTYRLDVMARLSGQIITGAPFRVSVVPADRRNGPGSVVQAAGRLRQLGAAWGGGPAGLQNVGIKPAGPQMRIALLFVDMTDKKFTPAEFPAIETKWKANIVGGVSNPPYTELFSVAKFYEQCSGGNMDVSLTTYGPYHLEDAGTELDWDAVGPVPLGMSSADAVAPFTTHVQAAITAAVDHGVKFADSAGNRNFDSILVVSRSVGVEDSLSVRYAWPWSTIGDDWPWQTDAAGPLFMAATQMPHNWGDKLEILKSENLTIFQTESHELGHNLRLADQYFEPSISCCVTDGFELMYKEYNLPNFTIAHRLALGWLEESWVRGFNFASSVARVDETVVLSPISADEPADDTFSGIEFRIADGWNYYSELRTHLDGQIADHVLMLPQCVLSTDVIFNPVPAEDPTRPDILLVPPDETPSARQLLINAAETYEVSDTTTSGYPADFKIELVAIDATQATVHVTYGLNLVPDPSITPWGAPPWQSPDIEVRNARNEVDDDWFNVPWEGHPNTVVAKVKNGGTLDAPGVEVSFSVKECNVGGTSTVTPLGTDTHDIARGDTVEFSADWPSPAVGHKCMIVHIAPYTRPAVPPSSPAVPEITSANNAAQSNYDVVVSTTASPAERKVTQIAVGNPYEEATRVYLSLKQTNPLYRTYLEHTWLDLRPGETRSVTAMFEYVGEPPAPLRSSTSMHSFVREPNEVDIQSFIVNPTDPTGHNIRPLGGVGISVATGLATKFATFELRGGAAHGQVTTSAGTPVTGGFVIFTFTAGKGATARLTTQTVPVHDRGMFDALLLPTPAGVVEAYFVAPEGYGDATASAKDADTPAAN